MYPSFHLNYPHYTLIEDELFQQQAFFNRVIAHEHSTRNATTNVRSTTMENSNYNNENFVTGTDGIDRSNSRVILGNNGLTGKRSSKKDRHSKIETARGPRDRRMRLSLDVAKNFFKLQDMLGFDKASNTIEWLLMKSKPAIQDLPGQQLNQGSSLLLGVLNSPSSASECEVLSGFDDQSMEKAGEDQFVAIDKAKLGSCSSNKEKMKLDRGLKKSAHIHPSLVKETRDKARARARKRTTEKRNNKLGCDQYSKFRTISLDQIMDQNVNRLGSCITFRENQVQTDQPQYPSSHSQLIKQGVNVVGDNGSLISGNWSPSSLFNYQHNPGPSHEHQLSDFQILGKPWEGNNN